MSFINFEKNITKIWAYRNFESQAKNPISRDLGQRSAKGRAAWTPTGLSPIFELGLKIDGRTGLGLTVCGIFIVRNSE